MLQEYKVAHPKNTYTKGSMSLGSTKSLASLGSQSSGKVNSVSGVSVSFGFIKELWGFVYFVTLESTDFDFE